MTSDAPESTAAGQSRELALRVLEAVLFAATEPLDEATLQAHVPGEVAVPDLLPELVARYADRGIRLERHGDRWAFRTAPDVAPFLSRADPAPRRLGRAALETLAVIAYRQPVTRAEIEAIRGVSLAKGAFDQLVESGWIAPRGRRDAPGRPLTWGTTRSFLDHFDLTSLDDLPRADEIDGRDLFARPVAVAEAGASEDRGNADG